MTHAQADRLARLIETLRDGRLHRAADLARAFGVSDRTIWRDMDRLRASGLPVEGARGVGYMLTAPITLPPVAVTQAEMDALRLGLALVASGADGALSYAARALGTKIAAVSPGAGAAPPVDSFVFASPEAQRAAPHLPQLRAAIQACDVLAMTYRDLAGRTTVQRIRPLQLEYWGRHWTLLAWCERRRDFRSFRIDLVENVGRTGDAFFAEPGKTLADYKARRPA